MKNLSQTWLTNKVDLKRETMSRYRVTERELLEQVKQNLNSIQEGRMKDIYTMAFDGDSAESIAKKLKLDVATVKKVLGEMNECLLLKRLLK